MKNGKVWHDITCNTTISNGHIKKLVPWKRGGKFRVLSPYALQINWVSASCKTALRWMLQNTFADNSTSIHAMAWRRQASRHHPVQYWPRSVFPFCVTRTWSVRYDFNLHKLYLVLVHLTRLSLTVNPWGPSYLGLTRKILIQFT